ncbi:MAG: transcription elongation factor [Hyphomicrobium sp.]|nr:MAG: transcription elongation factor [Hyphomicrobium sp.]PPC99756.1 MAG: transcription elongation factor [Hyphomicrobium sp.]
MSRAFVREPDGTDAFEELPDKLISQHRNLVTSEGLQLIETEVARLEAAHANAQAANDRGEIARVARDLRYWTQRRLTAELAPQPSDLETVQFDSKVTIVRDDGRRMTYRIVGEDEADPSKGTLSYVAPLAQALLGKSVGDGVHVGSADVEIVAIN